MGIFFHGLVLVIITLVLLFASSLITNALSDMSEDSSFPSMVNNRNKRDIDNEYSKNVSDIARHSSDDADVQGIVGIGIGFLVAALIIVYAILIVKLWGYVSLLNGTKRVSPFIINISEVFFYYFFISFTA